MMTDTTFRITQRSHQQVAFISLLILPRVPEDDHLTRQTLWSLSANLGVKATGEEKGNCDMPIKPENQHRYPANWFTEIGPAILERAGHRCESSPYFPECRATNYQPHPVTGSRVILTIAHLDHTPQNNDPTNLRAWCQRCHTTYDARCRAATRRRRRLVVRWPKGDSDEYIGCRNIRYGLPESPFHNPFVIGKDGTRSEVIAKFYYRHLLVRPDLMAMVPELEDKIFGCWCAPSPCYGDVLTALANGLPLPEYLQQFAHYRRLDDVGG